MGVPRLTRSHAVTILLLAAGLLLRLFFVHRHAFVAGDSLLYQEIADNWLHAHVYGLSTNDAPRPTLIRLPGYPLILAALALVFDPHGNAALGTLRSFVPVLYLQVLVDLATCLLLGSLAGRLFGPRARSAAVAMAALCPFTANYTAVPLTETFTLFTIVLSLWAAQRWRDRPTPAMLAVCAAALSLGILLRPDEALLVLAVVPLFYQRGNWRPALLCLVLIAVPFVPWTVRNAVTFHVFQPLAPRLANDPGDNVPRGFQRFYRTFGIDFSTTQDAYWKYPEEPIDPLSLPSRTFDAAPGDPSATTLLREAAAYNTVQPRLDAQFGTLAQARAHEYPVRTHLVLPTLRLLDMLLHPRTEMLPVDDRWWQYRSHPAQTAFCYAYGALNLALLLLACLALPRAFRRAPALSAAACAYLLLRCALLFTLDNAEQRYTLEFLPLWLLFASALATRQHTGSTGSTGDT